MPLVAAGGTTSANAAAALALAVGAVGLVASLLRLSFVADLLSRPILVGYMAGIAVLMIDSQIDRVLGAFTPDSDTVFEHVWLLVSSHPQWPAIVTAAVVLVALFLISRTRIKAFGPLLALILGVAVAALLNAINQPVLPPCPIASTPLVSVEQQEDAPLAGDRDVRAAVAIEITGADLQSDADHALVDDGFLERFVPGAPGVVLNAGRHGGAGVASVVGSHAFAGDEILLPVPVQIGPGQRVGLRERVVDDVRFPLGLALACRR